MVTSRQRKLITFLVKKKIWKLERVMWQVEVRSRFGTAWLLKRIKKKQVVDDLHHAPACPANHYHKMRLVFQPCVCGAEKEIS